MQLKRKTKLPIQVLKIKLIRITFRSYSMDDVKASMLHVYAMQSREGGKVLDSIQSFTTPDPGYHMGKLKTH